MMRDDYLDRVIRRGGELASLEWAADSLAPAGSAALRWVVAAAFGLLVALFPSVCTAHVLLQNI